MRPLLVLSFVCVPAAACSSSGGQTSGATDADAGAAGDGSTMTPESEGGGSGDDAHTPPPGMDAGAPASDGGGSHDGGTQDGGTPAIDYAPYFPTWVWGSSGYAYTGLADLQKKAGLNEVTIAFVLSGGGCNTTQDIEQHASDVKAFVAAGGHVKASFGGADGTYVESQCTSASALAGAIESFVDATGITDLDFDIEQAPVLTDAVNQMRGQALAMVQQSKHVRVAFTLAANPPPGGLTTQGLSVVKNAVSAGVQIGHVNLMTMDYGNGYAGQPLAPVAEGSLTAANAQLVQAVPGLDTTSAWRMLGVIPMIGKNDDMEVFSLQDATDLTAFAKKNRLGLVSFWSIDRDQVCPSGADYNSCSTVDSSNFEFDGIFRAVLAP